MRARQCHSRADWRSRSISCAPAAAHPRAPSGRPRAGRTAGRTAAARRARAPRAACRAPRRARPPRRPRARGSLRRRGRGRPEPPSGAHGSARPPRLAGAALGATRAVNLLEDPVDLGERRLVELDARSRCVLVHLLRPGRADDRATRRRRSRSTHASASCAIVMPRRAAIGSRSCTRASTSSSSHRPMSRAHPGARRPRAGRRRLARAVLAGERALRERRPDDLPDAVLAAERDHLALRLAPEQRVLRLRGDELRETASAVEVERRLDLRRRPLARSRGSAPCRRARPRSAPPSSPRAASRGRSGGTGRGRRGRSAGARSESSICLSTWRRERPWFSPVSSIGK